MLELSFLTVALYLQSVSDLQMEAKLGNKHFLVRDVSTQKLQVDQAFRILHKSIDPEVKHRCEYVIYQSGTKVAFDKFFGPVDYFIPRQNSLKYKPYEKTIMGFLLALKENNAEIAMRQCMVPFQVEAFDGNSNIKNIDTNKSIILFWDGLFDDLAEFNGKPTWDGDPDYSFCKTESISRFEIEEKGEHTQVKIIFKNKIGFPEQQIHLQLKQVDGRYRISGASLEKEWQSD